MIRGILALAALLVLGAGIAAGCTSSDTDDLEGRIDEVQEHLDSISAAQQRSSVYSALVGLRAAGLHTLDEAVNEDGEVPEGASGLIDQALLAMRSVEWPTDLQSAADELIAMLQDAAAGLDADADAATLGPIVADAHSAWHDFDHDASAAVTGGHGEEDGEHEEGGEGEEHEEGQPTEEAEHMEEGG